MFSFIKKNKILKELSKHGLKGCDSEKLADDLKIEHYIVYSLCSEIGLRNHIINLDTATVGHYYGYHSRITPQGQYFLDKGGYTFEWIKIFTVDFPKNFWWLIALLSYFVGKGYACN